MNCLMCADDAEADYSFRLHEREGGHEDISAGLCATCATELREHDWVEQRPPDAAEQSPFQVD